MPLSLLPFSLLASSIILHVHISTCCVLLMAVFSASTHPCLPVWLCPWLAGTFPCCLAIVLLYQDFLCCLLDCSLFALLVALHFLATVFLHSVFFVYLVVFPLPLSFSYVALCFGRLFACLSSSRCAYCCVFPMFLLTDFFVCDLNSGLQAFCLAAPPLFGCIFLLVCAVSLVGLCWLAVCKHTICVFLYCGWHFGLLLMLLDCIQEICFPPPTPC